MFVVHATKKLLDRVKVRPDPGPPEPTHAARQRVCDRSVLEITSVLVVNEPTLLPVLVPLSCITCDRSIP